MGNTTACEKIDNSTFCACPYPTTGKTDWISFETESCPGNVVADSVAWALVAAAGVLLLVRHITAFRRQYPRYKNQVRHAAKRGKRIRWYEDHAMMVIISGLVTIAPACIIVGILKVTQQPARQIGYDPFISTCYLFIAVAGFVTNTIFEIRSFEILLKSTKISTEVTKSLAWYVRVRYGSAVGLYGLVTTLAVYSGSFFRELPSRDSPMVPIVISRNIATCIFLTTMAKVNYAVLFETRKLMDSLSSDASKSAGSNKMHRVLDFLESNAKKKRKSAGLSALLYPVVCIPALWPYQSFLVVIVVLQFTLTRSHPINSFLNLESKSKIGVTPESCPVSQSKSKGVDTTESNAVSQECSGAK